MIGCVRCVRTRACVAHVCLGASGVYVHVSASRMCVWVRQVCTCAYDACYIRVCVCLRRACVFGCVRCVRARVCVAHVCLGASGVYVRVSALRMCVLSASGVYVRVSRSVCVHVCARICICVCCNNVQLSFCSCFWWAVCSALAAHVFVCVHVCV